ncbi:MAG: hypothetical protein RIS35_3554 [Pseudomonadota bacterium]
MLDTNVWLDLALFEDPAFDALRRSIETGELRILATPRMRDELADVLERPSVLVQASAARHRRGAGGVCVEAALAFFDRHSRIVPPAPASGLVCRDTDDQIFVDLAVAHRVRWLFSKDRAVLALARTAQRRHGLTIMTAARAAGAPL